MLSTSACWQLPDPVGEALGTAWPARGLSPGSQVAVCGAVPGLPGPASPSWGTCAASSVKASQGIALRCPLSLLPAFESLLLVAAAALLFGSRINVSTWESLKSAPSCFPVPKQFLLQQFLEKPLPLQSIIQWSTSLCGSYESLCSQLIKKENKLSFSPHS